MWTLLACVAPAVLIGIGEGVADGRGALVCTVGGALLGAVFCLYCCVSISPAVCGGAVCQPRAAHLNTVKNMRKRSGCIAISMVEIVLLEAAGLSGNPGILEDRGFRIL